MQFIADTGFIAGFWDPNDSIRNWARSIAERNPGPHLTCEGALVEACFLVGPRRIAQAVVNGDYDIQFVWQRHSADILELLNRYNDQDMDVTDACIVILAQQHPRLKILTVDRRDFTVYRTLTGKAVRCEFPAE